MAGAQVKSNCRVVVDLESGDRQVLGEFDRYDEGAVLYWREEDGTHGLAPGDCVDVVDGYRVAPGHRAQELNPPMSLEERAQFALGELGEALMKDGEAKDAHVERAMTLLRGETS